MVSAIFLAGGTSRLLLNNVEHEKQLFINSISPLLVCCSFVFFVKKTEP